MITQDQQDRLRNLQRVFREENTKLNLSALRTDDAIWIGNILDSLAILDYPKESSIFPKGTASGSNLQSSISILEVGTGGGFPLLPLAICKPDCRFAGMDSTQKKLDAIHRMIDALALENIQLIAGRAEELGHDPQYRGQFDIVLARALAPLNVLLELCVPFLRKGGHLIAWKSMKIETELKESLHARTELSCHLIDHFEYDLDAIGTPINAGGWGKRQLLIFQKADDTSPKYPREVGVPKKKPLI